MIVADPVNETKMSDNEAFQAFLSKNDDEGLQDDYWHAPEVRINLAT